MANANAFVGLEAKLLILTDVPQFQRKFAALKLIVEEMDNPLSRKPMALERELALAVVILDFMVETVNCKKEHFATSMIAIIVPTPSVEHARIANVTVVVASSISTQIRRVKTGHGILELGASPQLVVILRSKDNQKDDAGAGANHLPKKVENVSVQSKVEIGVGDFIAVETGVLETLMLWPDRSST